MASIPEELALQVASYLPLEDRYSLSSGMSTSVSGFFAANASKTAIRDVAVETMLKLLGNVVREPSNEKYRRIRLTNATIKSKVLVAKGSKDVLLEAGFVEEGEYLVLPESASIDNVENVHAQLEIAKAEAIQAVKDAREAERKKAAQKRELLREQMKADRAERAATDAYRPPQTTQASTLNPNGAARINRYEDVGVDLNKGGG